MPAQWKQKLAISIAFAALVYVCLSLWSNHVELKAALASFRWTYIPLLLLLSSTNFFLRFLKWQYYLRILDLVVPRLDSLLIFLSGFSMAVTPGKIGEILKSYLLRDRFSIPIAKTAPIVLADRLTDMVGLVVITTIGAVGFHYGQRVILIIGFILIGTIVLFSQRQFFEFLLRLAQPIPLIAKKTDLLRTLYDSSSTLLTPRALLVTIPVSVISWSCEGLAFYLTFTALGLPVHLLDALFIYAFSTIVGAVSFLPGGLGLTEATMAGLVVARHLTRAQAGAATIIVRVVTLWYAIGIGAIALLMLHKRTLVSQEGQTKKEVKLETRQVNQLEHLPTAITKSQKTWTQKSPGSFFMVALLSALVAFGLSVRAIGILSNGTSDLPIFSSWGVYAAAHNGIATIYHSDVRPDYAPGSVYLLGLAAKLLEPVRSFLSRPRFLNVIGNLFPTLFGIGTTVALFIFLKKEAGRWPAFWAALLYWINPGVLLNSPILGYQDPIFLFFSLMTLMCLYRRRYTLAYIFFALSIITKQPGLLIAPILLAVSLTEDSWINNLKSWLASGLILVLGFLPYLHSRAAFDTVLDSMQNLLRQNFLSANSFNIWWLATWWTQMKICLASHACTTVGEALRIAPSYIPMDTLLEQTGIPAKPIGLFLVGLVVISILYLLLKRIRYNRQIIFFSAAMIVFAYQMLAVSVHENHLIYFLVFFAPLVVLGRRYLVTYLTVSVLYAANLFLFYGFGRGIHLPLSSIRASLGIDLTVLLTVVTFVVFLFVCRFFWKEPSAP